MISAKQIADWAETAEAQWELPRLIRRLTLGTATLTQIEMPAGDSVSTPGFDGQLHSDAGDPWVPKGHSCWELSCRKDVATKANEDYLKRSENIGDGGFTDRTYIAVSARKWPGKAKWVEQKRAEQKWLDVRAYDADDLELWLENSPSIALCFAEELGMTGPGVTSVLSYLQSWMAQCSPSIIPSALLMGRENQKERILIKCSQFSSLPVTVNGARAVEMFAGNLRGTTQTMSLAIMSAMETNLYTALAIGNSNSAFDREKKYRIYW